MDISLLAQEPQLQRHLLALLLGLPRIIILLLVAPFAGGMVTGQLRVVIAFACYLPVHPAVCASLSLGEGSGLTLAALSGALLLKEILLGLCIGLLAGMLFWAVLSAGFFIDHERGASSASETDPMHGEETSPTGNFLFMSATYFFYASGAFVAFLSTVHASYALWPVGRLLPVGLHDVQLPLFFVGQVQHLMESMLLMAGPIAVACLLADLALGLINRFASQLNVYVLAMPVKCGIAAFLLLFYYLVFYAMLHESWARFDAGFAVLARLLGGDMP